MRARTNLSVLSTITCLLVILVGSIQAPFFLVASTQGEGNWALPGFQASTTLSHDALYAKSKLEAESWGLPPPFDLITVAAFPGQEVLSLPRFDMTVTDFLTSIKNTWLATSSFQLVTWDSIRGSQIEIPCGAALHLVGSFAAKLIQLPRHAIRPNSLEVTRSNRAYPLDMSDATGWERMSAIIRQTEVALMAAFAAVPFSDAHYDYLAGCATRVLAVSRPQLHEVPAYLRRQGDPEMHSDISSLPFTHRSSPVPTTRLEAARQLRYTTYRPRSYKEILDSDAIQSIHAWLTVEQSNMAAIAKYGKKVQKVRNAVAKLGFGQAVQPHDTLVIGQDQFLEEARDIIWDCRGFEHGQPAVPMDFNAIPNSDLNNEFIQESLGSWPDQELVGFLDGGVQFRAKLPLQIVLGPHLSSLSNAWANVDSEIQRLHKLGYYDIFTALPFLPIRSVPQGSTPRKLEKDRDRRTSDGGCPRNPAEDKAGVAAVSLNTAIGLHSYEEGDGTVLDEHECESDSGPHSSATAPNVRRRKWLAPEVKPRVQDKVWDDHILRYAAFTVFHEPLNGWTDDVADFFNHLPLAPSEYWTSCFAWLFPANSALIGFSPPIHLSFVSELRLGFGLSLSPNVAQRFSDAIIGVFKKKFDAEEELLFAQILDPQSGTCTPYNAPDILSMDGNGMSSVCRWIKERRRLTTITGHNQLRRYTVHMYTDDPIFTVIGQDALLRAMRIWHEVTESFGLRMAIPRKRQVGPCLTWLGFNFYLPAGVVTVAPSKLNRALAFAEGILQGSKVTFDQYRRFIGLLEHLLLFVEGDRTFMYGLYWDNYRRGLRYGPATIMHFNDFQRKALRRWVQTLMLRGGCFFSSALKSSSIPIPQLPEYPFSSSSIFGAIPIQQQISLFSDAFATSTLGGLGGYAHGSFWHIPLPAGEVELMHITAWEFVAIGINVIIFGPLFEGCEVYLLADALASVQIISSNAAHAPTLQILHDLLLSLPEFTRLKPNVLSNHVFGRINVLADAASRAQFQVVTSICSQMGIMSRHINVPARAFEFLAQAKSSVRRFQHSTDQLTSGPHISPTARTQSQRELDRMHHLGQEFIGNEDQPLMFKFTPWGDRSLEETMARAIGKSQAPISTPSSLDQTPSQRMFSYTQNRLKRGAELLLPSQRHHTHLLRGPGDITVLANKTVPRDTNVRRFTTATRDISVSGDLTVPLADSPGLPPRVLAPALTPNVPVFQTRPFRGLDGLTLPPMPSCHIPINAILTGQAPITRPLIDVYSILTSDESDHALRPRDPTMLKTYVDAAQHAFGHAAPLNTQSANRTGWNLWVKFLAEFGGATPALRRPGSDGQLREKYIKAAFLIWCRQKCVSSISGRTTIKPSTALGHLHAVRRVHEANGLNFLTKGQTAGVVKFLAREYELVHGAESLIPHKREGFTPGMVKRLLQSIDGLKLPSQKYPTVLRGSWLSHNLKAVIALCASAGFRRSEVSVDERAQFTAMDMSRASMFFVIREKIVRNPSTAELQSMGEGDFIGVLACPTKNDPLGVHFMPFPIIIAFHPSRPEDPGAALRNLALYCPVVTQNLRRTPLFTYSANAEPLGYNFLAQTLSALLPSIVPLDATSNYTWHSFRIGLACALRSAQAPDWVLLALLRWRSPSSIPGYGRISFESAASWLDQASAQEASSTQATNLPSMTSTLEHSTLPNALSSEAYSYLDRAWTQPLSTSDVSGLQALLPQSDDDNFVAEMLNSEVAPSP